MDVFSNWLDPELSLSSEIHQEHDRRAAVRLDHQQLQVLTDHLIVQCYRQQNLLNQLFRRVQLLEVEVVLAAAPPAPREPEQRHLEWAKELLAQVQG